MGQRIQLGSFLCGAFKKKHPAAANASGVGGGDGAQVPEDPPSNLPSPRGAHSPPLPPPPGGHHMRAASCSHQRSGAGGAASKLVSSMSMKVLGSAAAAVGRQASRREHKEKKMKHEDSIWKKTIILGEKCRVPDEEDEESILYDEKGRRIPTYHHRKSKSLVFSREATLGLKEHEESSSNK